MTTEELLSKLDERTKDISSPDRALYLLLHRYEKKITGIIESDESGYWFHKSFRQTDVTGSGEVDMAIWHLLAISKEFWSILHPDI